jgi:hypothetical protein
MNYFEFYDEYLKRVPSATPEQLQQAWRESGFAPSTGIPYNLL